MRKKILTGIILVTILLIVLFITAIIRVNTNILYTAHKQIDISLNQEFQDEDILNILKEVVGNRKVKIQKLEVYEDMVSISIQEISDEELENLNNKINEKYGTENTVDNIKVTDIPKLRFADYIEPAIKPFFVALTITVIYVGGYSYIINRRNR